MMDERAQQLAVLDKLDELTEESKLNQAPQLPVALSTLVGELEMDGHISADDIDAALDALRVGGYLTYDRENDWVTRLTKEWS
jgi:hypothetical protein